MKCWVIVPVKRLSAAKSRLAPGLSLRRRRELVCSLLHHVLHELKGLKGIGGKIVVGKDRAVRQIAESHGAAFVKEKPRDGLNRALARAAREAVRRGADSIMVLPADLPLLKTADLAGGITRAGKPPFVRIAPDRAGRGTNMLMMDPPGLIRFAFGDRSFRRHVAAARRAGARVSVIRSASLAQDLDCPEDLVRMESTKPCPGSAGRGRGSTKENRNTKK